MKGVALTDEISIKTMAGLVYKIYIQRLKLIPIWLAINQAKSKEVDLVKASDEYRIIQKQKQLLNDHARVMTDNLESIIGKLSIEKKI